MDDAELIARLRDYAANGCRSWNGIEAVFEDSAARIKVLTARLAAAKGLAVALRKSREGWENVVEMGIILPQHRQSAMILADDARAALAKWEKANV